MLNVLVKFETVFPTAFIPSSIKAEASEAEEGEVDIVDVAGTGNDAGSAGCIKLSSSGPTFNRNDIESSE